MHSLWWYWFITVMELGASPLNQFSSLFWAFLALGILVFQKKKEKHRRTYTKFLALCSKELSLKKHSIIQCWRTIFLLPTRCRKRDANSYETTTKCSLFYAPYATISKKSFCYYKFHNFWGKTCWTIAIFYFSSVIHKGLYLAE